MRIRLRWHEHKKAIELINQMRADGVIVQYAIGGAVGATFYLEPVATVDLGVFVHFQPDAEKRLATPKKIFDYLSARGGKDRR
ncbi:MAG: hypothetical protein N2379_09300 [Verrucomicrobiae bacterium]|nr:hypothetical protein [Verrucomicrobiae bacterium]